MEKIHVKNTLVEMTGDEMANVLWSAVREKLILPYVDIKIETYDLSLQNREKTGDRVTVEAAEAVARHEVGLKCATITASAKVAKERGLRIEMQSPGATIRSMLDGTIFRQPIIVNCVKPIIYNWEKPIIIARHAYGDLYSSVEMSCWGPGRVELVYTATNGMEERHQVAELHGPGIVQGRHNTDRSIRSFAKNALRYALNKRMNLVFGNREEISKLYHGRFSKIFAEEYETVRCEFEAAGITFITGSLGDIAVRVLKGSGGFVWACMNYDGDLFGDIVATGFGSHSLMTSLLVGHDGQQLFETIHGTIPSHFVTYLQGEETSTNPIATIFAWSGALRRRGEIDGNAKLTAYAERMESVTLEVINGGLLTTDLLRLCHNEKRDGVKTNEIIEAIAARLN